MNNSIPYLQQQAIGLLQQLIATPSFSKEESATADILVTFLQKHGITAHRYLNNVWACSKQFDAALPTVLLNSHHDTVKPNKGYTLDPFTPLVQEGKLYGLGSNDAGGCLVSLVAAFVNLYAGPLPFNLVLAATAEEEISGVNGIEALLQHNLFKQQTHAGNYANWCAIVGEPTLLNLAVAERGLMVLDATAHGIAGHAARNEGENALYKAMEDIHWFKQYTFEKVSPLLGPVKMSVTSIQTDNKQHNVVPAQCSYIVDVRVNELYTFEEVLQTIQQQVQSTVVPRSTRLRSTGIAMEHPLVKAGLALHKTCYGSPTTSDKALMPFPALKMGPGDSARSHTADEFIYINEIEEGVATYIQLLRTITM
jgi:acetylornithine deacetylase